MMDYSMPHPAYYTHAHYHQGHGVPSHTMASPMNAVHGMQSLDLSIRGSMGADGSELVKRESFYQHDSLGSLQHYPVGHDPLSGSAEPVIISLLLWEQCRARRRFT